MMSDAEREEQRKKLEKAAFEQEMNEATAIAKREKMMKESLMEEDAARKAPAAKKEQSDDLYELVKAMLVAAAIALLIRSFLFEPFNIPSGSLLPTLQIGDMLLGTKYAYGYSRWSLPGGYGPASQTRLFGKLPARGDVVIFKKPHDTGVTLIKRVVGLPGDHLQMVHGHLVINGKMLPLVPAGTGQVEDAHGDVWPIQKFTETLPGGVKHTIFKAGWDGPLDDTVVYVVPAGHIFGSLSSSES